MCRIIAICSRHALAVACLAALAASCKRGGADVPGHGGPPQGAMPAMAVDVITLSPSTVERTSEFIGTVKSRQSSTVQPQVEGFITRIGARSGDRVRLGATLMEIDAGRQEATVATLEAQRAARDSETAYWRQQTERLRTLLAAGAVSQQEFDQAATTVRTGEAQLAAIDQQIREQRVELAYYRVVAPAPGVVGDIPVRVGDRVTTSTVLTTIDGNRALEVYIQVPVQQAPDLTVGLPVRLVDDRGETLVSTAVSFIAPSVDPGTQSVLAKAALERSGGLRNDQYVRARVVWQSSPGLTVPLVSVSRINGRFFVFVAETAGDATVVHQRPVELGALVGNDYVVTSGLSAGDRLVVSGVQKIGDGMPVTPRTAAPAAAPAAK